MKSRYLKTKIKGIKGRKKDSTKSMSSTKRIVGGCTGVLIAVVICLLMEMDTLQALPLNIFKLNELEILGCNITSPAEIVSQASLQKGENILSIDLVAASKRLESHPWISRAILKRTLPGTLQIYLTEREPRAVIVLDDLYLVDRQGEIFKRATPAEQKYPRLSGLTKNDLYNDTDSSLRLIGDALYLLACAEKAASIIGADPEIIIDKTFGLTLITAPKRLKIDLGFGDFEAKIDALNKIVHDLAMRNLTPEAIHLKSSQKAYVTLSG